MPVTIYPTNLKYKNSNGQFQSATAIKGDSGAGIVEQVNGTAPTIVCEDNHRYICGEILSLNITPPANGVCEIIFKSGSTATVLTAPNTIKWPEWFNPNSLETNATYQFKISNGLANVAIWPDEGLTGDTRVRIQKMLGIYEAPWELIKTIKLTETCGFDVSVDENGESFSLRSVYIIVYYPANLSADGLTGYARYRFLDENGKLLNAETGKYTTTNYANSKFIKIERSKNAAWCIYGRQTSTGGYMQHFIKYSNGFECDYGNVVRIQLNTADNEPVGTQISIYGQRAY